MKSQRIINEPKQSEIGLKQSEIGLKSLVWLYMSSSLVKELDPEPLGFYLYIKH